MKQLSRLDALVQRWFDRRYVWLMERGVSKRVIRWNLWILFVTTMIGGLALFAARGSWRRRLFAALVGGIHIAMYGWLMSKNDEDDARVEGKLFRSQADDLGFAGVLKFLGVFQSATLVGGVVGYLCGLHSNPSPGHDYVLNALHAFASFALAYLCGTPPVRPKPREERTLLQQAAQP